MEIPSLYAPLKFDTGAEQANQQLQLRIADQSVEMIRSNREYADSLERTNLQQKTFDEWMPALQERLKPYTNLSTDTTQKLRNDSNDFLQVREQLREAGKGLFAELTQGEASKLTNTYNQFNTDYAKALADKEYANDDVNIIYGAHKKNILTKPGESYTPPTLVKRPDINKIRREAMGDMTPTEITNSDGSKSKYYDPNVLAALLKRRYAGDQDVIRYYQVMGQYAPDQFGAVPFGKSNTGEPLFKAVSRDKKGNIVRDTSGNPVYKLTKNPKEAITRRDLDIENQVLLASLQYSGSTNVEPPVDKNNPVNGVPTVNITEKAPPLIPIDKEGYKVEQDKTQQNIKKLDKVINNKALPEIDRNNAERQQQNIITENENNKGNIRYLTGRTANEITTHGYTKNEVDNVLFRGAIEDIKEKLAFIKKKKGGFFGRLSPELQEKQSNLEAQLNRAERIQKDYTNQFKIEQKKLNESYNTTDAAVSVHGIEQLKQPLIQALGADINSVSIDGINNDSTSKEHNDVKTQLRTFLDKKKDNLNDYIRFDNVSANEGGGSLVIRGTVTEAGIDNIGKMLGKNIGDSVTFRIKQGGEAFHSAIRNSNNSELTKWSQVAQNPTMTNINKTIEKIPLPLENDIEGPTHVVKEGGITAKISKSPMGTITVRFKNDKTGESYKPVEYNNSGEATEQIYQVILHNQSKK